MHLIIGQTSFKGDLPDFPNPDINHFWKNIITLKGSSNLAVSICGDNLWPIYQWEHPDESLTKWVLPSGRVFWIVSCSESNGWKHLQISSTTTGWWLGHPSEKYERQLGWLDIPNINGKTKNGNQTTNQTMDAVETYPSCHIFTVPAGIRSRSKHRPRGSSMLQAPCVIHWIASRGNRQETGFLQIFTLFLPLNIWAVPATFPTKPMVKPAHLSMTGQNLRTIGAWKA